MNWWSEKNKKTSTNDVDNVGEKLGKTIDKDNPIVPHLCKPLGAAAYYAGNEMAKSTARIVDEAFGDGGNYE